jgi:hypothetical protein
MQTLDRLNELADLDSQLRELHDQNTKATARQDWPTVNKLQAEIGDLMKRKRALRGQTSVEHG